MSADNLLLWMSARGQGSWQQFRSAVEELLPEPAQQDGTEESESADLPTYQRLRQRLQQLAHVEFISVEGRAKRWRIVPPTLAVSSDGQHASGILCGGRWPQLRGALDRLPQTITVDCTDAPEAPTRIRLAGPREELLRSAAGVPFLVQNDAPTSILAALPTVLDPNTRVPQAPPTVEGWTIHRFLSGRLAWTESNSDEVQQTQIGLFRFRLQFHHLYFLKWRGAAFRLFQVQVGKFAVLWHERRRNLPIYDRARMVYSVPVGCRPPPLMERALVLCSGLPPHLNRVDWRLEYADVPLTVAQLASGLLLQETQVT